VPKLSLSVSGDGLGAKLRIEAFSGDAWRAEWSGPAGQEGERLRAFLSGQGIASECIRDDILKWISRTLANAQDASLSMDLDAVQDVDVAQGREPLHEEPQGLVFHHAYLADGGAIADLRRKADAWGSGGLRESIEPAYWVSSGETVLSFLGSVRGRPGCDVFGAAIPFMALRDRLPPFGKSLFLKERKLIAVCEGALIIEDGQLKVLGPDSLPTCQVVPAEDGMSANLVLGGNYLNDWTVTLDMVKGALREKGVVSSLADSEILPFLNRFNRDHLPLTLQIARGREPVRGRDGRLHLLVDPEPEAPMPGADGSIDFKDFSFFRTVSAGAHLAQVVPPSPGEPGLDVFGRAIMPPEAEPFSAKPGGNTALEGSDPVYVAAVKSGRLAVRMGIPEVVEVLDVTGDVSLKTGNIEFPGAVKVSGDVHGKMEIRSVGDVEVVGTVEDSVIRSDGAIVIRGGVNGTGGGLIKSRLSSVTIGYLHNQRIESHSHIVVYNEIINSHLKARKSIQMRFGRYSVLGGHLLAGEGMDLFNIGSEAGSKTILEVGKDFEVEAEMESKTAKLRQDMEDLEFLREMEEQLAGVIRLRRGAESSDVMLRKRTQGAMEVLEFWIASLRKDLAELSARLWIHEPCTILIRGIAHPGTVLKYHDEVIVVPKELKGRKWVFREKGPLPPAEGAPY
jgi:uncharacterized protein